MCRRCGYSSFDNRSTARSSPSNRTTGFFPIRSTPSHLQLQFEQRSLETVILVVELTLELDCVCDFWCVHRFYGVCWSERFDETGLLVYCSIRIRKFVLFLRSRLHCRIQSSRFTIFIHDAQYLFLLMVVASGNLRVPCEYSSINCFQTTADFRARILKRNDVVLQK